MKVLQRFADRVEEHGEELALHGAVRKISFSGSTAVGKLVMQYAGRSNLKHVGLECGGKSPQIFLADLPDMGAAVACLESYRSFTQTEACWIQRWG